jgi:GT2 family glycosyltransferase
MKKKILIFIVTYKASFRLLKLIQNIPYEKLFNFNYTIYISDDNSKDLDSLKYINLVKKKYGSKIKINYNKKNLGYGGNIKKCLNYAFKKKFDYAIMLHGDNQYNPKYINTMLKLNKDNNFDAIVGSRMMKKGNAIKGNMPIYKYVGNIVLSKCFNLVFNTKFTDCHTGYWFYNLKNIPKFFFDKCDNNFCFDLDLRLQLVNNNKRIKEVAINTFYGTERSSFHIIYAIRFFYKVMKYKFFKIL